MTLEECRSGINRINRELVRLFCERMELSAEVAAYKKEKGLPILDPAREREILAEVAECVPSELAAYAKSFFASTMEISRAYQSRLIAPRGAISRELAEARRKTPSEFPRIGRVACQGSEGAYSQIACDRLFGEQHIVYFKSFEGVFSAVENGLCDYGVLPIENSTHGSVGAVLDLMQEHRFRIIRSLKLKVDHALLAPPGVSLGEIREIHSHPQAIGQCSRFFEAHPEIKAVSAENTALAAKALAESGRRDVAVIASVACGALYRLERIPTPIQNSDGNFTRFICIARKGRVYPGASRISLTLTLAHTPGTLYSVISKLAIGGCNLLKIESRPIEGSDFEFRFYLDFEAPSAEAATSVLDDLENSVGGIGYLGCYAEL